MNRSEVDILSTSPATFMMNDNPETLNRGENDNNDGDNTESDEEHDRLSNIHNFRGNNPNVQQQPEENRASIRRTDSWTSFVTRSERNILLGKDKPPSAEEAKKRKVKFVSDDQLEVVHEVATVPEEMKSSYWMNDSDFDRLDKEVSLTKFRWENHKSGKIKFDENQSSWRGLEHVLEADNEKALKRWKHVRSVLEEINSQRLSSPTIDWEKVRKASEITSKPFFERAQAMGKADEVAKRKAWSTEVVKDKEDNTKEKGKRTNGEKTKKRGFMFWKK